MNNEIKSTFWKVWGLVSMSLALTVPAGAATIGPAQTGYPILELTPSQTTVSVGDTFSVDLIISGFAGTGVPGMSGFEMGVGWSSTHVALDSYSLGTTLGDPGLGQSIDTSAGQTLPGLVEIGLTSLLPASYLTTQLPDQILLATFEFTALAPVTPCNCIVISAIPSLFDGNGDMFLPNVINEGVQVSIVPLPAALWLLVAGLFVLPRHNP